MKNLKRFLPYLKKYKHKLYIGFLFVTISNICSTYIPRIVGNTVDTLSQGNFDKEYITLQIIYILTLTIGSGLFMFLTRQTIIYSSRLIEYDLRSDLMRILLYSPSEFFRKQSTGNLMAYATNDIPAAREFIGPAIMYGANTITTFLFAFYFMFSLNIEMTAVAVLPLPIITLVTYYIGKKVHFASKDVQDKYADLTMQAQESISGVRIIRSYNREKYEAKLFGNMSADYLTKNLRLARLQSLFMPAMMVLVGFSFISVLAYGGYRVINGQSTIGDLTQFFIYLTILIWPVAAIGYITNIIQRASAAAARLGELFDSIDNVDDNSSGIDNIADNSIIFKNVEVRYEKESKAVLSDINLEILSGKSLGIIGPVGSGKSTLINLLPRLVKNNSGDILIGNIAIDKYNLNSLRNSISVIPQDTFLFSMSIADNIRFAKPNATLEEIIEAAKAAELHDEVLKFEQGYDTILGERGISLSGGQKQRTSIARAILRKADILILDDALSAVDADTEAKILRNLKSYIANQTTIIISHRVSALTNADMIISLIDGKIVEKGTHEELLAASTYYSNIYNMQKIEDELAGL